MTPQCSVLRTTVRLFVHSYTSKTNHLISIVSERNVETIWDSGLFLDYFLKPPRRNGEASCELGSLSGVASLWTFHERPQRPKTRDRSPKSEKIENLTQNLDPTPRTPNPERHNSKLLFGDLKLTLQPRYVENHVGSTTYKSCSPPTKLYEKTIPQPGT